MRCCRDVILKCDGMEKKKPSMSTNCQEAIELLAKIKGSEGKRKLNKLGEWLAKKPEPLFVWEEKDLKYILK
jgi:hypothetical protein